MYLFDEISKMLGEENLNLRLENISLKKISGERKLSQEFSNSSNRNLTFKTNSKLIFLKLAILTKMVENFYEKFSFSKNNKFLKLKRNPKKNYSQDSHGKILKISILLKNFHSIFFRLRNIFFKFSIFLSSIRMTIKKIKSLFKDLLIIELISHHKFKFLPASEHCVTLKSGNLGTLSFTFSLKNIIKLKRKFNQKKWGKKISLKFVKGLNKKKVESSGNFSNLFLKEKVINMSKKNFLPVKLTEIKNKIKKTRTNPNIFFSKKNSLILAKSIRKLKKIQKKKYSKLKKLRERRISLLLSQNFLKGVQIIVGGGEILSFCIFKNIFFNSKKLKIFTNIIGKLKPKKEILLKNLSSDFYDRINQKKKKILKKEKNQFSEKGSNFPEKKKKERIIQKTIKDSKFLIKELIFSRTLDLKKDLELIKKKKKGGERRDYSKEERGTKKENFFWKEKAFLSVIFSLKKRNSILKNKIKRKTINENDIRKKLIEIKGMETDFSEIIKIIRNSEIKLD